MKGEVLCAALSYGVFHWTNDYGRYLGRLFTSPLWIILLCVSHPAAARAEGRFLTSTPDYLIHVWETENGLPENSATAMTQTLDGYLWFGTFNGLVRFNGVEMVVFDKRKLPGLPSVAIINVYADKKGRLWVSTDRGLGFLRNGRWHEVGSQEGWHSNYAKTFSETADGQMAILAHDGHLYEVIGDATREIPPPEGFEPTFAHGGFDAKGDLWLGCKKFFGRRSATGWERVLPREECDFHAAVLSPDGGIWLLDRTNLCKWVTDHFTTRHRLNHFYRPWSSLADRRGNVWLATYDEGLCRIDPAGGQTRYSETNGLTYNSGRFVFEDREGVYWAGTSGGGLHRFLPRRFHNFTLDSSLLGRSIKSVCEISPGNIVAGTFGSGIARLENGALTWSGIPERNPPSGIGNAFPKEYIGSLATDATGRIWIGADPGGLFIWDGKSVVSPTNTIDIHTAINSLFLDSHQRMWIGTTKGLYSSLDGEHFETYGPDRGLTARDIRCFEEDKPQNRLWIGSNDEGLFDFQADRFRKYGREAGLAVEQIHALHVDSHGDLFLGGMDGGLVRRDKRGRFVRIGEAENLPIRQIACILEDARGYLWLGHNQGILRVNPNELDAAFEDREHPIKYLRFDANDGLASVEVVAGSSPSGMKDSQGRLWFCTIKGLAMVDPARLELNSIPPPIQLEAFLYHEPLTRARQRKNGGVLAMDKVHRFTPPFAEPMTLPAGSRHLEFHYAPLCYRAPAKTRNQVLLEGFDRAWLDADNRRVAYYHDLPPGQYRFRARAANNDGVWNETGVSLAFAILPFFWQTIWFRAGAVLVFGSAIGLAVWGAQQSRLKRREERLQQREALAAERARSAALTQYASDIIMLMDKDGRIIHESPSTARILGYPEGYFLGKHPFSHIHPEDQKRLRGALAGLLANGGCQQAMRFRCQTAQGTWIHLETIGANLLDNPLVSAVMTTTRDISERISAEDQLRLLSEAVEQSPDVVVITNPAGEIEYVNQEFVQVTGYTMEEVIGRNPNILKSGLTPPEVYQAMWTTIRAGNQWLGEFQNRKKNGDLYWESAVISPIKNHAGEITHFLANKQDVTKLKQAEEIKTKLEARLQHSQKMESLGTLAGGIAHDFNNILSAIVGFTELARLDAQHQPEIVENLNQVSQASERAKELIRQILSFSRHRRQERKPIRLQAIVGECLNLLRSTLPASIQIETDIQAAPLVLLADASQIHQVVMNLCTNAAQSMRNKPGRLRVGLAKFDAGPETKLAAPDLPAGEFARLWVSDSGQGIAPEMIPRIFDPFFTTKGPGEGTGLGLAVVHGIVKDHDGIILVDSQPNVGSTFQVFFPTTLLQATESAYETREVPRGQDEHILFVDDEPALCQSAHRLLHKWGYQVTVHTRPEAALADFRARPEAFAMVITDLSMPGMSGLDMAAEITKVRPDIPIMLASGFMGEWTTHIAQQTGINEIIIKPVNPFNLGATIHRLLHSPPPPARVPPVAGPSPPRASPESSGPGSLKV